MPLTKYLLFIGLPPLKPQQCYLHTNLAVQPPLRSSSPGSLGMWGLAMPLDGSGSVSLAWFSIPASSSPPWLGLCQWVREGEGLVGGMQVRLWPLSTSCPGSSMAALLLGYTVGSCLSWETEASHQVLLCPDRRRCESTPTQKAPFCLPSRNNTSAPAARKPFWGKMVSLLGLRAHFLPLAVPHVNAAPATPQVLPCTGGHPEASEFTCSHQQTRKQCKMRLGLWAPEPPEDTALRSPPVMSICSLRHNLNKWSYTPRALKSKYYNTTWLFPGLERMRLWSWGHSGWVQARGGYMCSKLSCTLTWRPQMLGGLPHSRWIEGKWVHRFRPALLSTACPSAPHHLIPDHQGPERSLWNPHYLPSSRLQISNHHSCLFLRSDRPGVSWGRSQRPGFSSRIHFLMASGRSGGHSSGQVLSRWILRLEEAGPLMGGPSLRPCYCSVHSEVLHTLLQCTAGVCLCPFLQRRSCCSSVCGSRRSQACNWSWALSGRSSAASARCFQSRAPHSWQLVLDVGSGRWRRIGQEGDFQR